VTTSQQRHCLNIGEMLNQMRTEDAIPNRLFTSKEGEDVFLNYPKTLSPTSSYCVFGQVNTLGHYPRFTKQFKKNAASTTQIEDTLTLRKILDKTGLNAPDDLFGRHEPVRRRHLSVSLPFWMTIRDSH
jgi:hypothetical protein